MRPLHNSSVVRTFDALFTQQSCVFQPLALNNRFAQPQNIGHFAIGAIDTARALSTRREQWRPYIGFSSNAHLIFTLLR